MRSTTARRTSIRYVGAAAAEGLPDAGEQPGLRLPGRLVAPRLAQERVEVGGERLAGGLGGAAKKVGEVDVAGRERHVGRPVGHQDRGLRVRKARVVAQ